MIQPPTMEKWIRTKNSNPSSMSNFIIRVIEIDYTMNMQRHIFIICLTIERPHLPYCNYVEGGSIGTVTCWFHF